METIPVRKVKRVIVDRNLCIGAGSCVVAAPTVFELNGENKAVIKQQGGVKKLRPGRERSVGRPGDPL